MNRAEALKQLHLLISSPNLLRHCYAVEEVMAAAAIRYGEQGDNAEKWRLAGLLHDCDYELFPDEHPNRIVQWLREKGENEIAYAISAHWTKWNVPHRSRLDKALLATDEPTGLSWRVRCLVRMAFLDLKLRASSRS